MNVDTPVNALRLPSRAGSSAFTLVELMSAIVIVGVLVALAVGTTQRITLSAKASACASNMRQLSQIAFIYSSERNGELLPTLFWYNSTQGRPWSVILDEVGLLPNSSWEGLSKSVMRCPARDAVPSAVNTRLHYGMNTFPGFNNRIRPPEEPVHRLNNIQDPGRTLLFMESRSYYVMPAEPQNIAFVHDNVAHGIYADGHIERVKSPVPTYPYLYTGGPVPPVEAPPYY